VEDSNGRAARFLGTVFALNLGDGVKTL